MMKRGCAGIVGVVLVAALLLIACASQSADSEPETPTVEEGATSMAGSSPIDALLLEDGGFDASIANYLVTVQEEVALCMVAQGFEYAAQPSVVLDESRTRARALTPRQWTDEFGYGISTSVNSFDPSESADPNAAMLSRLSESERQQWFVALTGGGAPEVGPDGIDRRPLEDQGCLGQALGATGGTGAIEGLTAFGDAREDQLASLLERRDVITAVDAWSRCMSEAGYPDLGTLDEPESEILEKVDALRDSVFSALPLLTDEERQAWIAGEGLSEDLDFGTDELRELQAEELALARVDLDCYETHVQSVYEPLRDDVENGLIDAHRADLEALTELGD